MQIRKCKISEATSHRRDLKEGTAAELGVKAIQVSNKTKNLSKLC